MVAPARKSQFKKTVFGNGLTLVSERHTNFRSLAIGVWVKAGTRHERPHEAGVSHFLEHMLFKGTETRSALQIAREVEQVGGEFNAFTTREYTCFHVLLLERDVQLGVEILSDILLNTVFDPEEMEKERKVILQEIAMVDEAPEEIAHDLFFELTYPRHGLGRPILGTEKSIRQMRRGDLMRYFRKRYRPEDLVISVAGDVSHDTLKRLMKPLTKSRWPGRSAGSQGEGSGLGFAPAPKLRQGAWWVERPTEQVHLVWGVEGPKYSARDRFAAFLLNVHLGGGMSSTLFQEIREKNGLAYTVYSSLSPYHDTGSLTIYAATGMSQVPLCVKLVEECVSTLSRNLLADADLKLIKDNLKGTILLSADSVESRMSSIALNEIFLGKYVPVEEACKLIDEVTPRDIRRVARALIGSGRKSLLALGPKPSKQVQVKLKTKRIAK